MVEHDKQEDALEPSQVRQEASQSKQFPFSKYFPSTHVEHSFSEGPEQVEQEEWHPSTQLFPIKFFPEGQLKQEDESDSSQVRQELSQFEQLPLSRYCPSTQDVQDELP